MTVDPRTPCIIGVGQRTWHPGTDAPEPLEMWALCAEDAIADAEGSGDVRRHVDSVQVVYCQSWPYDDPPGRLGARLGVSAAHTHYSGIGGETPQALVDTTAARMLAGELELALIAGGEALFTRRQLKKAGERPAWSHRNPEKAPFPIPYRYPASEIAHQVFQAYTAFALLDSAWAAREGLSPRQHADEVGATYAPMTAVAAATPEAWFRAVSSAEELAIPTPDNRLVVHPYTKRTVAVMDIDQAGALLLATHARADQLGVPADRRVYLRGSGWARGPWVIAQRPRLASSPGLRAAGEAAFGTAGIGADDVEFADLYSCFHSSVRFAQEALGLDKLPTVTGGLPFFGGAGSCYVLMSLAHLSRRLREHPGAAGVATGVGMHMTKHRVGVYSTEPGVYAPPDGDAVQARVPQPKPLVEEPSGDCRVAAITVEFGRDLAPARALAIIDLPDGGRAYAQSTDPDLMEAAVTSRLVGKPGHVDTDAAGIATLTM